MTIQVISETEYLNLPEKEKEKWVRYNPTMQDKAVGYLYTLANGCIDGLNQLGDLYSNMKFLPNPSPAEQLGEILKQFESFEDALKALEKLDIPGISAIVNTFKSVAKAIGAAIQFCMLMWKSLSNYSDMLIEAYENVDWERLKKSREELEGGDPASNTPGIEATMSELHKINWPSEKIKKDMDEVCNEVKNCTDTLKQCEQIQWALGPYVEVQKNFTEPTMMEKLGMLVSFLGIDLKQIQAKIDETEFPDPKVKGKQISDKLNSFIRTNEYIKKTDLEMLQKKAEQRKNESLNSEEGK